MICQGAHTILVSIILIFHQSMRLPSNNESLRTLYQLELYGSRISGCFPTNPSLRVLRVRKFKLSSLGSLVHLRYLELYHIKTKKLPNSIYNLHKLEILKLKHLPDLLCLPERLNCLKHLRHLIIEDCFSLSCMFPYIGRLSSLRTVSVYIVRSKTGHNLAELRDLKLEGKLSIEGLENVSSLSDVREANLMGKKDLRELCLSWSNSGKTKTRANNAIEVLHLLQPHSNLKCLRILHYEGLYFPSWIEIHNCLVYLELRSCKNCVQFPPFGKLPFLKQLILSNMDEVRYVDVDESHDGVGVRVFPSLEKVSLLGLPNFERLLKMERREMFRLSDLTICGCPKLVLQFLPSLKDLIVIGCNSQLLRPISSFHCLTTLLLSEGNKMTSFPEGMLRNLTCLQTLILTNFPKLKELPNEPLSLALERLQISRCGDLESSPEQMLEGLQSLRTIEISSCGLRSLPECIRNLTSLEVLTICDCPTLKERCNEGTGEDYDKIAHIPKFGIE
ncbi:putative leucine-rich repeat domain, L domain-containing protein [Medicago truncatula]|uniref:Putative leucine-rich repeat domain, L domain-containing protein n=1 Tax=Medicago truncatula TaxID=3880 RepID=A0A396IG80_MEDTR|nr:putative disease resistance protein RGA1 [Medicago truncatula]RHN64619.1 putative leucine-rich repeat domain, L domain-containing protein [Medicago truncatula]